MLLEIINMRQLYFVAPCSDQGSYSVVLVRITTILVVSYGVFKIICHGSNFGLLLLEIFLSPTSKIQTFEDLD